MPINRRTKVTLIRITALLFALSGGVALVAAFSAHQQNEDAKPYIKQAVMWSSLGIVFLAVARIKRKTNPSEQGDSSK
jgi:hypothetical protein